MKKLFLFVLFSLQFVYAPFSQADEFVVNTGPGPAQLPGWSIGSGEQWLAAEFVVDHPSTITSVKGWILDHALLPLEIAILSDVGEIPGTLLYSGIVNGSVLNLPTWTGLTGLGWYLEPGTYWVSFGDTRSSLPVGSGVASASYPSVNPLKNEAIWHPDRGWSATDTAGNPIDLDIGVQIIAASDNANEPVCWQANGHCYQNIAAPVITWGEARVAAENMFFRGVRGHLATITSQAEQDFINTTVMPPPDQVPPFGGTRGWIGGFQQDDGEPFEWVTGEPFVYTNWRVGEPRGDVGNNFIDFNWELADWNDTANLDPATDGYLVEYPVPTPFTPGLLSLGDTNGDGTQDIAALVQDAGAGTLTATVKDAEDGGLINTVAFDGALSPVSFNYLPDLNSNGAPELVVLGTGSVKAEVRDSLTGQLLSTVDYNRNVTPFDLAVVPDQDGNSIPELAVVGKHPSKDYVVVETRDALTGNQLGVIGFGNDFIPRQLLVLPDVDGNGEPEYAVLLVEDSAKQRVKVAVRNSTGALVQNIWLGKVSPTLLDMALLEDMNGNGAAELAILRSKPETWVSVLIADALTGDEVNNLLYNIDYTPLQLAVVPDLNGNGSVELAVLGHNASADKVRAQLRDAVSDGPATFVGFWEAYTPQDLVVIPDFSGNGAAELGMLGLRPGDGKLRTFIKDALNGALVNKVDF